MNIIQTQTTRNTTFFADKEAYLKFRQAWSQACNDPRTKKCIDETYGNKYPGWLTAKHYLLFAILTQKDPLKAFTPNKEGYYHGLEDAIQQLSYDLKYRPNAVTEPFSDTITPEMVVVAYEQIGKISTERRSS